MTKAVNVTTIIPIMTNPGATMSQNEEITILNETVDKFAAALKAKLVKSEEKYGWEGGWKDDLWYEDLIEQLHLHIEKGDPMDVAAYCMFAWYHKWVLQHPTNALESQLAAARSEIEHAKRIGKPITYLYPAKEQGK
jgi:hypothetical protein